MGLRLSDEIAPDMYNYGHLQVLFDDGSVGWYEAGWGPMMSETAFFVKDVISPERLRLDRHGRGREVGRHRHPHQDLDDPRAPRRDWRGRHASPTPDEMLSMAGEPGHQELCDREQAFVLKAIREDLDLTATWTTRCNRSRVCLAADESVRTGQRGQICDGERAMGSLTARERQEVLRHGRGAEGHRPRGRGRRVRRLRRPVGLRQVHAAAHHRRAGGRRRRATSMIDGEQRHRRAAGQARHRHGVPDLRALPASDRARQHGLGLKQAGTPADEIDSARRHAPRRCCRSSPISSAARPNCPAASASASPSAAPSCASRSSSCSTSRCPISMRRCASTRGSRSRSCTAGSRRR